MNRKKLKNHLIMAGGLIVILYISVLLLYYLRLGLPHMFTDEPITVSRVLDLASRTGFELDYFKYPGLNFYYGSFILKIINKVVPIVPHLINDKIYLLRVIYFGSALLSTYFLYLSLVLLLKSRNAAILGCILSVSSLYIPQYLYYAGPDTLLICWGNLFLYLSAKLYLSDNEERNVYMIYPLICILIGMAASTKYHAVLFLLIPIYMHICKGYYKSYRNNFVAVMSLVLIPITFAACNIYMFADFRLFMEHVLFNFEHYKEGHVGLDDDVSVISYLRVFLFSGHGYIGGVAVILGIVRLLRQKNYILTGLLAIVPAGTILLLGRYHIFLARNIALTIPFRYVFMTIGFLYARHLFERPSGRYQVHRQIAADAMLVIMLAIMLIPNIAAYVTIPQVSDSRIVSEKYINEAIPEGATIYITQGLADGGGYYMPDINTDKYHIITDSKELKKGDYIVDTSYRWKRWYKKQTAGSVNSTSGDGIVGGGVYLYPELLKSYENEIASYQLIKRISGLDYDLEIISSNIELLKYVALFRTQDGPYWGPTIDIYISR